MTTRPVMSASRVASLVALVRSQGRADGANLVAFSGGVGAATSIALPSQGIKLEMDANE